MDHYIKKGSYVDKDHFFEGGYSGTIHRVIESERKGLGKQTFVGDINGINNTFSEAAENAKKWSDFTGHSVDFVYSMTKGPVIDVAKVGLEKMGAIRSEVNLVRKVILDRYNKGMSNFIFRAHSSGVQILDIAGSGLPKNIRSMCDLIGVGPARRIMDAGYKRVANYVLTKDYVSMSLTLSDHLSIDANSKRPITYVESSNTQNFQLDHSILGTTYTTVTDFESKRLKDEYAK